MGRSETTPTGRARSPVSEVACPQCGEGTDVPVPNREVELKVRPSVAAFGEHSVVHCSRGHKFWVYYC